MDRLRRVLAEGLAVQFLAALQDNISERQQSRIVKTVVLVGTARRFQCLGRGGLVTDLDRFRMFLRRICAEHSVRAIAEEMSEAELAAYGARESTAQLVCREQGLLHCFGDPSPGLRRKIGVRDLREVKVRGFYEGWSSKQTELELRKAQEKRERYWLKQIQGLRAWPVLFVCGADHFELFAKLLRATKFKVVEVCSEWRPGSQVRRL